MDAPFQILYQISMALLAPVAILLIWFASWSLFELGGFLREWRARRRTAAIWSEYFARSTTQRSGGENAPQRSGGEDAPDFFEFHGFCGLLRRFADRGRAFRKQPAALGHLAASLEIEAARSISSLNVGVRIAPMLGLMGTLIPLGPALLGLSQGNLDALARNMVVAFTTTIVGLFAGGVCYVLAHARRHWYSLDMAAIEFVLANGLCSKDVSAEAPRSKP